MTLYEKIEKLCEKNNINVTDMCSESGASRGSLGDLKSGKKKALSIETLYKISRYFGITIDELICTEKSRIHLSRRYSKKDRAYVAQQLNIDLDCYNNYENNECAPEFILKRLANILDVDFNFISGKPYVLTTPVVTWDEVKKEDYESAPEYDKIIMEYKYGNIRYVGSASTDNLSQKEKAVINSYRNKPGMQPAVDKLLGIDTTVSNAGNIATDVAEETANFITSQQITSTKQS